MGLSNPSCFIDYIIKNKKIWKKVIKMVAISLF